MKKIYTKPKIEIEVYSLSESIASNCDIVVSNGPAMGNHSQCDDYEDPFGISLFAIDIPKNVNFYNDTKDCDCYTTSQGPGYWTS